MFRGRAVLLLNLIFFFLCTSLADGAEGVGAPSLHNPKKNVRMSYFLSVRGVLLLFRKFMKRLIWAVICFSNPNYALHVLLCLLSHPCYWVSIVERGVGIW